MGQEKWIPRVKDYVCEGTVWEREATGEKALQENLRYSASLFTLEALRCQEVVTVP